MNRNAVILLSGGLDSATILAIAKAQGFTIHALSFSYGQRHSIELEKAKTIAERYEVEEHKIAEIDLRLFGGSALTGDLSVPKHDSVDELEDTIPVTYVPARNTIFLSFALAYAETINAFDIFIGVNAVDYSGYPDCRPEFIQTYEAMANQALAATADGNHHLTIHTPLLHLTKADIIKRGLALGVDYGLTLSCYDPSPEGIACGHCDSCLLRAKGFSENGMDDPALV